MLAVEEKLTLKEIADLYPVPSHDDPSNYYEDDENQEDGCADDEDQGYRDIEYIPSASERRDLSVSKEDGVLPQICVESPKGLWRSSIAVVSEAQEEVPWLIQGILPAGAIVLLSGREGDMKSFLAMSMARAIAAGTPWLGKGGTAGAVLYLNGEMNSAVMQDRLRGFGPIEQLNIWSWMDAGFPTDLNGADLQKAAQCHKLIVVDTLRRHMQGLKENCADDMAKVTAALRELTRHGACVLALHHASKNPDCRDYRGSTELGAGVDITMFVTKKGRDGSVRLILETHKTRYSSFEDIEIKVGRGEKVPIFTIQDSAPHDDQKASLDRLWLLIRDLSENGQEPIQKQIISEATKGGLGGKDKILRLLQDGENTHWASAEVGNRKTYRLLTLS